MHMVSLSEHLHFSLFFHEPFVFSVEEFLIPFFVIRFIEESQALTSAQLTMSTLLSILPST